MIRSSAKVDFATHVWQPQRILEVEPNKTLSRNLEGSEESSTKKNVTMSHTCATFGSEPSSVASPGLLDMIRVFPKTHTSCWTPLTTRLLWNSCTHDRLYFNLYPNRWRWKYPLLSQKNPELYFPRVHNQRGTTWWFFTELRIEDLSTEIIDSAFRICSSNEAGPWLHEVGIRCSVGVRCFSGI